MGEVRSGLSLGDGNSPAIEFSRPPAESEPNWRGRPMDSFIESIAILINGTGKHDSFHPSPSMPSCDTERVILLVHRS